VRTCQKADMIQSDCQRSLNWSVILKYICSTGGPPEHTGAQRPCCTQHTSALAPE